MKELIVKAKGFLDDGFQYICTYDTKRFEMIVGHQGYGYTLTSGDLTDEEWDDVIAKHYHGEYINEC